MCFQMRHLEYAHLAIRLVKTLVRHKMLQFDWLRPIQASFTTYVPSFVRDLEILTAFIHKFRQILYLMILFVQFLLLGSLVTLFVFVFSRWRDEQRGKNVKRYKVIDDFLRIKDSVLIC